LRSHSVDFGLGDADALYLRHEREGGSGDGTPGAVAYQLTAAVYRWFGHTDESIPYADDVNGVRVISEQRNSFVSSPMQ